MATRNATDFAVASQLAAIPHDRYEVGISVRVPDKDNPGELVDTMLIRRWTEQEIEASLGFLKAKNMRGSHIYIRPCGEHGYSFVDDLSLEAIGRMRADGFPPALVVESSPGNYQAWVAHGQVLPADVSTGVAKELAKRYGGDPSSADWRHFGRLVGFTNRKEKYQRPDGRFPFVRVTEASGQLAPESPALVAAVRSTLEAERAAQAARRQAYIDRPTSTEPTAQKTIDDFRSSGAYGGDAHRADLAYATYALSRGMHPDEVRQAIASRDLSHKGSMRRQDDYIERTLRKAENAQSRGR